jgi:hypothetical protein
MFWNGTLCFVLLCIYVCMYVCRSEIDISLVYLVYKDNVQNADVSHTKLDMVISSAGLAPWLGQNDNRRIHVWVHVEQ